MRITRVRLEGFGCLRDVDLNLASGLNLFYGPNEAGKSTLQQGILALLYGFFEGERRRSAETRLWEGFAPWRGGSYRGQLEYALESGQRYRVDRDFATPDIATTVWDADVGADVTRQFGLGRHGNVPFARRHLGMTRAVFQSCAFLSQGELFGIVGGGEASPQEIGDTIVALADTGRRDLSAETAASRLDQVLREAVGGARARAAPLPVARQRLTLLAAELREIEAVREEISSQAIELETEASRLATLEEDIRRTRYLLRDAQVREMGSRLEQLDQLSAQMSSLREQREQLSQFAAFPSEERDDVLRQRNTVRELSERLDSEDQGVSDAQVALSELTEERDRLARERAGLSHLADFPIDKEASINNLFQAFKVAESRNILVEQRYEQVRREADPILAEYGELAREVGALTAGELDALTAILTARPPSLPVRVVLAVGGAIWGLLCLVGLRLLHAVQWVFAKLRGRPVPQVSIEGGSASGVPPAVQEVIGVRARSLPPSAARTLLERHRRFLELAPKCQALRSEEEARAQANAELEAAAQALRDALEPLIGDVSDVNDGVAAFEARAKGRERLVAIDTELEQVDARRKLYSERIDAHGEAERRRDGAVSRLQERLSALSQEGNDLDELVKSFEEGCRRRRQFEDLGRQLEAAEEREAVLLGGKSRGEVQEAERTIRQEVSALLRRSPSLQGARTAETPEALERRLSRESEELRASAAKTEGLRAGIETRMAGLRPKAEVEEELERCRQEVVALEEFGAALSIAAEVIRDAMIAAHRDFAPSVGRFLGEGLSVVTAGRYRGALLNPSTLAVTVQIPETGTLADSEVLSRGTRAAAYILLRVGLAQHMSSIGEPIPLMMDDPLVDLDDVRLENFLELVLTLTERVQVLLFTKDRGIADWFSTRCRTNEMHQLYAMPAPSPAGADRPEPEDQTEV